MITCPVAKHLFQFRENTPSSQSCFKFQVVRQYVGWGEEGWGWGSDVGLFSHSGICWVIVSPVCSRDLQLVPCSLVPRHKVPTALTHFPRRYRLICFSTGVSQNLAVCWVGISGLRRGNCSLVGKLTPTPLIISASFGPPLHPSSDVNS